MILQLIALAAAVGINYACFDQLYQEWLCHRADLGPPLQTAWFVAASWQVATTLVIYVPLRFLGAQTVFSFLAAWTLNSLLWNRFDLIALRSAAARVTGNWHLGTALHIAVPIAMHCVLQCAINTALTWVGMDAGLATQCLVGAVALFTAWFLDAAVQVLAKRHYRGVRVPLIRAAVAGAVACISALTLTLCVNYFVTEPVRASIQFLGGVASGWFFKRRPDLVPVWAATRGLRFQFELLMGLVPYHVLFSAWWWPELTARALLAAAYTAVMVQGGAHLDHGVYPVKALRVVSLWGMTLGAISIVLRWPWVLAPLPLVIFVCTSATAVVRDDEVVPLVELQRRHEHHSGGWLCTSQSHRFALDAQVAVPFGEEATWHRCAANYYREVLANQYFFEVAEVTRVAPSVPDDAARKFCNATECRQNLVGDVTHHPDCAQDVDRACAIGYYDRLTRYGADGALYFHVADRLELALAIGTHRGLCCELRAGHALRHVATAETHAIRVVVDGDELSVISPRAAHT